MPVNAFQYLLLDCRKLSSEGDLMRMLALIQPWGLTLADGIWNPQSSHPIPARDVARTLEQGHRGWQRLWPNAQARPTDPQVPTDLWFRGLLWSEQPRLHNTLAITRLGLHRWQVSIQAMPPLTEYQRASASVEQFAAGWSGLFDEIGQLLYNQLAPELALVTTWRDDEAPSFEGAVLERRLAVGWRTWFGPAYVTRYGREWLHGLPDHTRDRTMVEYSMR